MTGEKKFQLRQSAILLFTSLIWGVAFVAQSMGMDYIGPYTLVAIRFLLGALTLLPVVLFQNRMTAPGADGKHLTPDGRAMSGPILVRGGVLCGIALGCASTLQQIGISQTTVGKAGFITALYIVIVPVISIFLGRRTKKLIWLCVVAPGDAFCLACAFVFSIQITLVAHYVSLVDGVRLAVVEFLTSSAIGFVLMLLFEHPQMESILKAAWPLLYLGVLSSGAAYTLQIIGQRGLNPTLASLIMSLESAISALAGFLFLHQTLTPRELFGCALMAAAIVLAQLV